MGFGWWNGFVGCMWRTKIGPPRREEAKLYARQEVDEGGLGYEIGNFWRINPNRRLK
jgi:hypothetical protein